ncbi:MAG TPA: ATP-binding protein [Acidobacteriota bacterium]|jgi:DNA replication protein DnaC
MPAEAIRSAVPDPCPRCGDTGWTLVEIEGVQRAARCDCFVERRRQRLIQKAGFPRRYLHCSFDKFNTKWQAGSPDLNLQKALQLSRDFVGDYPDVKAGLMYLGPCGVGKTHLAIATGRALILDKGAEVRFYDFRDLLREIQDSYNPESTSSELRILQPVIDCEVLILDELGAKKPTEWVKDTVTHLLTNRYNERRITIITSNYVDQPPQPAAEKLEDRIGTRLRSRLYEMCRDVVIDAKDYRQNILNPGYHR